MKTGSRPMLAGCMLSLALLGAAAIRPIRAESSVSAQSVVDDWPEPSRVQARAMIDKYGNPNRRDESSLSWFGLFGGKRTVIYRAQPGQLDIEQAVLYHVPVEKVSALTRFDPRITVKRRESEMSVRTDSVTTNLLTLNLAHEIASGFKSVAAAQAFRDKQTRLAAAGKSSRYRDGLLFEQAPRSLPSPFILPGGVNPPPRNELKP